MESKLNQSSITRRRLLVGSGAVIASSFVGSGGSRAEELLESYDGRREAPCPPESIASLLDPLTQGEAGRLVLALVPHRYPTTMPSGKRNMWVCMRNGHPLWVIDSPPRTLKIESSGLTAAALKRARAFIAKREESRGKERLADSKLKREALLPSYQSEKYDMQITAIELIDREKESWEITAKPITDSMGGEIWMRFSRDTDVSAEYGR